MGLAGKENKPERNLDWGRMRERKREIPGACQSGSRQTDRQTQRKQESRIHRMKER